LIPSYFQRNPNVSIGGIDKFHEELLLQGIRFVLIDFDLIHPTVYSKLEIEMMHELDNSTDFRKIKEIDRRFIVFEVNP
jgi:hypothetical protein